VRVRNDELPFADAVALVTEDLEVGWVEADWVRDDFEGVAVVDDGLLSVSDEVILGDSGIKGYSRQSSP
jgi:hypothetical protein